MAASVLDSTKDDDSDNRYYVKKAMQVTNKKERLQQRALGGDNLKRELEVLKMLTQAKFQRFITYCFELDMAQELNEWGNEDYKKRKGSQKDMTKNKDRDPWYCKLYFNANGWWCKKGLEMFPHLAVGVMIIFGKPSHNGFQERVFSLGTFKDSRLRKSRSEDNFEMTVLERVNHDLMSDYNTIVQNVEADNESKINCQDKQKMALQTIQHFFEQTRMKQSIIGVNP